MKEILSKRQKWYRNFAVQYNLLSAMRDREVAFMDRKNNHLCIRGLCIRSINILNYFFDKLNFFEKDYNIYISCAKYKFIPKFTLNLKERSKETFEWFTKKAKFQIFNYDIFLDFDSIELSTFLDMKKELSTVANLLDYHNVCFSVHPSGNGYHIIIDSTVFETVDLKTIRYFTIKLKNFLNLKHLDLKGIGIYNKIRKCEYSLVYDKVVFPLRNLSKINLGYEIFDSNKILKNELLNNRGLIFHNNFGGKLNNQYFNKFLKINFLYSEVSKSEL